MSEPATCAVGDRVEHEDGREGEVVDRLGSMVVVRWDDATASAHDTAWSTTLRPVETERSAT